MAGHLLIQVPDTLDCCLHHFREHLAQAFRPGDGTRGNHRLLRYNLNTPRHEDTAPTGDHQLVRSIAANYFFSPLGKSSKRGGLLEWQSRGGGETQPRDSG